MKKNEPTEVEGISQQHDKAIRLLMYLKDLCALRTTQVRNVDTYDQVFWLHDLPRHKLCSCTIWRLTDPKTPSSEQHTDSWVETRKPVLKSPPELPDELEPWVKDEELTDSLLSEPGFYEQIPFSALQGDLGGTDPDALAPINDYPHVFDRYSGTLQEIAIQINHERGRFEWFIDRPKESADPSVSTDDLLMMAQIHRKLTPELAEQLKSPLFPLELLIQPNEFRRHVEAEKRAALAHKEAQDNLFRHFHSWAERVCREISGDQDRVWRQILTSTIEHIDRIEFLLNEHGSLDVTGVDSKDLRLVKEHACALMKHLEMGKGLGFWFVRARVVKDNLYLVKSVKVNGKPCNNLQTLNQLIAWIEISTKIKNLADLWKGITTPPTGTAILQCSAYRDLCKPIEQALALHGRIEEVRTFNKALDAVSLEEEFAAAQQIFALLADFIANIDQPSTKQLRQAVNNRDIGLYRDRYESLSSLHTWARDHNFALGVLKRFHACAPRTCERYDYDKSYSGQTLDERFAGFEDAWIWAKTYRWLDEASDKERPKRIQKELEISASGERDALKNLAASKAWQHCMTKLGPREEQALKAWKLAVGKIKEHGKDAEYWREIARQRLEECRNAIPAWVMPLYQVVQTSKPKRAMYDIAIIDEASQSGPEALLLNFIADRLIVVGDDKQITPMYIGVELEHTHFLRRKYLDGIEHAETLMPGRETSLFSQAFLRFRDHIQLREHFRCMPEIIQFSNNLSYSNTPLIPLRQYGAGRLEPVQTVFVNDGYRKGASDDIENLPEAQSIVTRIAECCEDPVYAGKTFGVISLMGSRQAELVNSLLLKEIGAAEMEERRLVCGRPYDFQGDERDVIFLSMVDAPQDGQPCRMIRDADTQRRFNVAASRAKDQLWLFHSATLNDLKPECLRYSLLEYCLNPKVHQPEEIGETTIAELRRMACNPSIRQNKKNGEKVPGTPFDSWFEVDVFFKIIDKGYRVLPQYKAEGYWIDLVIESLKGHLAVECDGDVWHGPDRYKEDMIREGILKDHGWIFWRVRGYDFYRDQDAALTELWATLERLKITPRNSWESDLKQPGKESTVEDRIPVLETAGNYHENIQSDAEEGQDKEDGEESSSVENAKDQLDLALEYGRLLRGRPEEMPPLDIQNAILQSLRKCPNHSCTLKSLTSRVLKELGMSTRGNPRLEFEKRVMRNLGALKRKGMVEEYKAKNKRLRLIA